MMDIAYYNGVITPYDAACIPLSDRSVFFADAVYDVMIGRGKFPYQAEEHLSRLLENGRAVGFENLPSPEELAEAITDALSVADAEDFTLYIQLSGRQKRRLHSRTESGVNLLITVTELTLPTELSTIRAMTLPDLRHGYCNIKTTNLFPAVLSVALAESAGSEIAIFHKNEWVSECSYANVSIVSGGVLLTHPHDTSVLPGISEQNLIRAAEGVGLGHEIRTFTVAEMLSADLVLITSTTKLLKLCTEINGRQLPCRGIGLARALFEVMKNDFMIKTDKKSKEYLHNM